MDVRSRLNEFLQGALHENVEVSLVPEYLEEGEQYVVWLTIHAKKWRSDYADSIPEAKDQVMLRAMEDMKEFKTERKLRAYLKMALICRIEHINALRKILKALKKEYKTHEKRDLIPLLAKFYPIVDKLEHEMQQPPWCMPLIRLSDEWYDVYGIKKRTAEWYRRNGMEVPPGVPEESSEDGDTEEDTGEDSSGEDAQGTDQVGGAWAAQDGVSETGEDGDMAGDGDTEEEEDTEVDSNTADDRG